jgi:hypothetical protein
MTEIKLLNCIDCKWSQSEEDEEKWTVNQRAVKHYYETGHEIEAEWNQIDD